MQIDQVERYEVADRIVVGNARAQGAEIEMPEPGSYRALLDAALLAEPEPESANAVLLRSLGVA